METYKCLDCGCAFKVEPTWKTPACHCCGEHLDVTEITDQEERE